MNYQEQRMKELYGNLPQNRDMQWDSVAPVIDFDFSKHPDPVKARKKNIKQAVKTLKPVRRSIGILGYKYNSKPYECVVTGVDCRTQDYGDLRKEFLLDDRGRPVQFTPWSGVVPGRGRPMTGTYCPQALQLFKLLSEWMEQEERENERGFFRQMRKKGVSFIPIKKPEAKPQTPLSQKWGEAFVEAEKDGIPVVRVKDSYGRNRISLLVFDYDYVNGTGTDGRPFGHPETINEFMTQEKEQDEMFNEAFDTAMREAYQ
tara:strand:- start:7258 stop:8034 length:777 start_codon:yes stop_codon:yes gene_type:complete